MGQAALVDNKWMRSTDCCQCGVTFAMTHEMYEQRLKDHVMFYCPNGHPQHFTGRTKEQQRIEELERQLKNKQAEVDSQRSSRQWAESCAKGANIAAGKAKAALRRTITRVHAGACPHCNRTFRQLARHMQSKHKDA